MTHLFNRPEPKYTKRGYAVTPLDDSRAPVHIEVSIPEPAEALSPMRIENTVTHYSEIRPLDSVIDDEYLRDEYLRNWVSDFVERTC